MTFLQLRQRAIQVTSIQMPMMMSSTMMVMYIIHTYMYTECGFERNLPSNVLGILCVCTWVKHSGSEDLWYIIKFKFAQKMFLLIIGVIRLGETLQICMFSITDSFEDHSSLTKIKVVSALVYASCLLTLHINVAKVSSALRMTYRMAFLQGSVHWVPTKWENSHGVVRHCIRQDWGRYMGM